MGWSKLTTRLFSTTAGINCSLLLSLACYSQADSTKPVPKTFILSKYQLPTQGDLATTSFFSVPLQSSPYKIHYKIKTQTFPNDPDSKPKRFNLIDALITGYLKDKDKNEAHFITPIKKY